jgi:glucosyl-3-phosphoglycerate synthase
VSAILAYVRPDVRRWYERRTSSAADWPTTRSCPASGSCSVSVVLPAHNEAATVGAVVTTILREAGDLLDQVLVVDSASTDDTAEVAAEAGAEVIGVERPGKGRALAAGLAASSGELVVFLDADLRGMHGGFVSGLLGPLLTDPSVHFVKGTYARTAGRVTELVARPLVNLHWPRLAGIAQPLAGEYAGRRALLETLAFEPGYGVDLGLLLDAVDAVGLDGLAQVDLGRRVHRHHSDAALGRMAAEVLQAALRRLDLPPAATTLTQFPGGRPVGYDVSVEPLPPLRGATTTGTDRAAS